MSHKERGLPILVPGPTAEWVELASTEPLPIGTEILVPTLFGGYQRAIVKNVDAAVGGGSVWFLEASYTTWRCWGGGNLAAYARMRYPYPP